MKIYWFEIRRKLAHILFGLVCMLLIYADVLRWWMMLIVLLLGLALSYVSTRYDIPVIRWFLRIFDRPAHLKKLPGRGALGSAAGIMIVMFFFGKGISLPAIAIWTFGDALAALVGMHLGKIPNPLNRKLTLEGTISGMAAATLASMFFIPASVAFIASFATMLIECIELRIGKYELDDNILLPLIGGIVIYILLIIL